MMTYARLCFFLVYEQHQWNPSASLRWRWMRGSSLRGCTGYRKFQAPSVTSRHQAATWTWKGERTNKSNGRNHRWQATYKSVEVVVLQIIEIVYSDDVRMHMYGLYMYCNILGYLWNANVTKAYKNWKRTTPHIPTWRFCIGLMHMCILSKVQGISSESPFVARPQLQMCSALQLLHCYALCFLFSVFLVFVWALGSDGPTKIYCVITTATTITVNNQHVKTDSQAILQLHLTHFFRC